MEGNTAFSDAVARAKQIAAKLATAGPFSAPVAAPVATTPAVNVNPLTGGLPSKGNPNEMPLGPVKRSLPSDNEGPDFKRHTTPAADSIAAQLKAMAGLAPAPTPAPAPSKSSAVDAAKAAAEQVAAKLNQSLGVSSASLSNPPLGGVGPHAGLGLVTTEEWSVPNRCVGLVIGSKGESISQIQSQSGCKIQIAPDPTPGHQAENRHVTLSGTADSIVKAKELINSICKDHAAAGESLSSGSDGQITSEIMIPSNKVGLVIGKGGEMIKSLQMRTGTKMVMMQDGPWQNAAEKPLKISANDSQTIEAAKGIVKEFLNSKDGLGNLGDSADATTQSMPVPREAVGVIIGKGGDMIRTIQGKFKVRVQFQQDNGGPTRVCDVSGSRENVEAAQSDIMQLIERGGGSGDPHNAAPGFGGPGRPRGDYRVVRVPVERCGIVIGKGGENIRQITQISGAYVELNKNSPPGPDKEFHVSGNPDQIEHAMQLISEKVDIPPRGPGGPGGPYGGPHGGPYGGPHGGPRDGPHGGPHDGPGGGPGGPPGIHGGPRAPPGGPGGWGGPPQGPGGWSGPSQGHHQQAYDGGQQNWGGYNYNQWGQPNQGAQPQSGQGHEQAWQAYYAQYYNQYQQQSSAGSTQPSASQPTQSTATSASSATTTTSTQPKTNAATGQPDYSEQWIQYYRQNGMHAQAEAVIKQREAQQAQAGGQS